MKQKEGHHQNVTMKRLNLEPSSSQNNKLCSLYATQSMLFCYSSTFRLRYSNITNWTNITDTLFFFFCHYHTVHFGWPCMAWLIGSLSYPSLWSMWSFWLAFCDFHSGCCGIIILASSIILLMDEDKKLMHTSWWEDWLWGKLGIILVGRASTFLIQFSAYGWGCAPSLLVLCLESTQSLNLQALC